MPNDESPKMPQANPDNSLETGLTRAMRYRDGTPDAQAALPAGTLRQPFLDRQGDEQWQPSHEEMGRLSDIQADQNERGLPPLRATMSRTADGLFLARYGTEIDPNDPAAPGMADQHLGDTEAGVKVWVEEMAKGMGYREVIWED